MVKKLGQAVKAMQGNLPLLQALRNPALRERHWGKLATIMGTPLVTDPPLTLAQLLDLKVCNTQRRGAGLKPHSDSALCVCLQASCFTFPYITSASSLMVVTA